MLVSFIIIIGLLIVLLLWTLLKDIFQSESYRGKHAKKYDYHYLHHRGYALIIVLFIALVLVGTVFFY
ncbi:YjcZ family sporulation protein [Sporolactobacillus sp. THM7-4]|nr:YjcZ family sporulation protein [Sporolactobacillus sp. THM7-4]